MPRPCAATVAGSEKPCVATFLGMRGVGERAVLRRVERTACVGPCRPTPCPRTRIRALDAVTRYAQWRARDRGAQVAPVGHRPRARPRRSSTGARRVAGRARADAEEARELLGAYGIRVWPASRCPASTRRSRPPTELGYPVILKSTSPLVRHQPGLVGVRGDLVDAEARARRVRRAERAARAAGGRPFRRAADGRARRPCVIRAARTRSSGRWCRFCVAGPPTELLGDVGHRIPPLTDVDVTDLIYGVKAAPLLTATAARPRCTAPRSPTSSPALSVLADDHPEVARWSSTRSTPDRAASTSSAPRSSSPAPRAQGPRPRGDADRQCRQAGPRTWGTTMPDGHDALPPSTGRALPEDLTRAITRAGYYPALVSDVVESASPATRSSPTSCTRRRRSTTTRCGGTSPCSSSPRAAGHRPRRRPRRRRGPGHERRRHRDHRDRAAERRSAASC